MPGPQPKSDATRVRRNAPVKGSHDTVVPDLPFPADRAPAIPDGRARWSEWTLTWWDTWATSRQAWSFTSTDWQRLRELVPFVDRMHLTDEPGERLNLLKELRLHESRMGALAADRRLMSMVIRPPTPLELGHQAAATGTDGAAADVGVTAAPPAARSGARRRNLIAVVDDTPAAP